MEDRPIIKGIATKQGDYKGKTVYRLQQSGKIWHFLAESLKFIDDGDKVAFKQKDIITPKTGTFANIPLYVLGGIDSYTVIPDSSFEGIVLAAQYQIKDDDIIRECMKEAQEGASSMGWSIEQFLDRNAYKYSEEKFYDWWLRRRVYRKLWLLGIYTSQIEELCAYYRCGVGYLYELLQQNPLRAVPLKDSIIEQLCGRFKFKVTPSDRFCSDVAKYIYSYLIKERHTYMTVKYLQNKFKLVLNYKEKLIRDYFLVFYTFNGVNNTEEEIVQFRHVFEAEKYVAETIRYFLNRPKRSIDKNSIECSEEIKADPHQITALISSLEENICIIQAPPGRGKSRIIGEKYNIHHRKKEKCTLIAFTGQAVEHLRDEIGVDNTVAMTIDYLTHKSRGQLEAPQFSEENSYYGIEDRPNVSNLFLGHVVIDEASMSSTITLYDFFVKYRDSIETLTIVGDTHQLQPLQWGTFMDQLSRSGAIKTCTLVTNYRDLTNAYQIDENGFIAASDYCRFYPGVHEDIVMHYKHLLESGVAFNDAIMVTPLNEDVDTINFLTQQMRISLDEEKGLIINSVYDAAGKQFSVGDKVVLKRNLKDERYKNGAMGIINRVNIKNRTVTVRFKKGEMTFALSKIIGEKDFQHHSRMNSNPTTDMLRLAYCLTVHGVEGKQWPYVSFMVPPSIEKGDAKFVVQFFNYYLINTAVSRTRKHLAIFGNRNILNKYYKLAPSSRNETLATRILSDRDDSI